MCSKDKAGFVTPRSFGDFTQRFSPLAGSIRRALDLLQGEWFHWDIHRIQAEQLLERQRVGTFLIRLSPVPPKSDREERRLSLSYVEYDRDGVPYVNHVMIWNRSGVFELDTVEGKRTYALISQLVAEQSGRLTPFLCRIASPLLCDWIRPRSRLLSPPLSTTISCV